MRLKDSMLRLYFLSVVLLASSAFGQADARSLEQLGQDEKLRRAIDAVDDVQAKLEIFIRQREADCQKAIGHQPFCNCLMKGLPIAWSFSDYIAITTRSMEDNGYSKMKIETRLAYDKVGPIRNLCVKILHTPRKQQR
jgi:hypothetical protein